MGFGISLDFTNGGVFLVGVNRSVMTCISSTNNAEPSVGDVLIAIDGDSVFGLQLAAVLEMLSGIPVESLVRFKFNTSKTQTSPYVAPVAQVVTPQVYMPPMGQAGGENDVLLLKTTNGLGIVVDQSQGRT